MASHTGPDPHACEYVSETATSYHSGRWAKGTAVLLQALLEFFLLLLTLMFPSPSPCCLGGRSNYR